MKLRVHRILYHTSAEGMGNRSCIWVQGCRRRCPGCMAVKTWEPSGGFAMDTEEIMNRIAAQEGLEGVTFLGGEPFEQAEALGEVAFFCRQKGLSVISFTGYTLEELKKADIRGSAKLLQNIDLLIDGPYIEEKRDFSRPWVGSSNQRYLFLTDRYCLEDVMREKNRVEVRMKKDGSILLNGMADFRKLYLKTGEEEKMEDAGE